MSRESILKAKKNIKTLCIAEGVVLTIGLITSYMVSAVTGAILIAVCSFILAPDQYLSGWKLFIVTYLLAVAFLIDCMMIKLMWMS